MPGARKILYGTERVLDAKREQIRDFLSDWDLDFGTKVRCYVEGETEIGALKHATREISGIEYINLRGQVIASQGKGLSFKDSLKNDLKSKVFSIVFIDADRADYVRTLKKAAEEDLITGGFYVAKPDFEFAHFTLEELINVVLLTAKKLNISTTSSKSLLQELRNVASTKEFFKMISKNYPELSAISKGEEWGRSLMKYALEHKEDSPLVKAALMTARATRIKFDYSRRKVRVDSITGECVKR